MLCLMFGRCFICFNVSVLMFQCFRVQRNRSCDMKQATRFLLKSEEAREVMGVYVCMSVLVTSLSRVCMSVLVKSVSSLSRVFGMFVTRVLYFSPFLYKSQVLYTKFTSLLLSFSKYIKVSFAKHSFSSSSN